ncbi:MAG TPA: SRPBCC family protein [Kineosporiaceae bacterium]
MDIHFKDSREAAAPAEILFDVIVDYASYPRFNPAVSGIDVVRHGRDGAEFVARRRTAIGRTAHAYDAYRLGADLVVERTYEGMPGARSIWTVHPLDGGRCLLTIDAAMPLGPIRGLIMKPLLRRIFYRLNFTPFIREAERRAAASAPAGAG